MKCNDEWDCLGGEFCIHMLVKVIFAVIVFSIVFGIVFSVARGVWGGSMMAPYSPPGWIWDLVWLIFLIWLLSWIFRWPWHMGYLSERHEMRILRRRYAKGEITEAEFKRMTKTLRNAHN